jgi:hypothetical protein
MELSALVSQLNKNDIEDDKVHCASFLLLFYHLGFKERSARLTAVNNARFQKYQKEKERQKAEEDEIERKNALQCDYDYSMKDRKNAIEKLRNAALLFEHGAISSSLKAFEMSSMPPHVFKEQLRRIFMLNLTPKEVGALMKEYDGKIISLCQAIKMSS